MRRFVAAGGAAIVLSLGFASAAHAVDYPPTTQQQQELGSTVSTPATTAAAPADGSAAAGGLPFTGGDDSALVWIGLAAVGAGSVAAVRFRRRPRTS
jgi:hypothetical protein